MLTSKRITNIIENNSELFVRDGDASAPQKFWFAENLGNIPKIRVKMASNIAWLQKIAPKVYKKTHEKPLLEVTSKKVLVIFVGEKL